MKAHRRKLLLGIAYTDVTFSQQVVRGESVWVGRCIHCRTRLVVTDRGDADANVTIEHIVPRHHGGTDALPNLALACARCNAGKGTRHDHRRADDPVLIELLDALKAERARRWRDRPGA